MILEHNNKSLARKYYESLPASDISKKFYEEGVKYESPSCICNRFVQSFFIKSKLETLLKFYPYQKTITQTVREIQYDTSNYIQRCLIFTAVSWLGLYQLARRGVVLPLLREYGIFFNTHRLFRHYLYSLVGPLAFSVYQIKSKYYTHVEHLWIVHANRLNQKILEDPLYTYYPDEEDNSRRHVNAPIIYRDYIK